MRNTYIQKGSLIIIIIRDVDMAKPVAHMTSILHMYAYKETDRIAMSNDRPRTNIGQQGDHVTAYAIFKAFIRGLKGNGPEQMIYRLAYVVDDISKATQDYQRLFLQWLSKEEKEILEKQNQAISTRIQNIFTMMRDKSNTFSSREEIEAVALLQDQSLVQNIQDALLELNQVKFDRLVTFLSNEYLAMRNQQQYASFPQEGNVAPLPGEANRVKAAVSKLANINAQLDDNAQSIDSAMIAGTINAIFDLFWYPKIPEKELLLCTDKAWGEASRKYNTGTAPRNNNPKILYFVTAVHINTIRTCFPSLPLQDDQTKIVETFIKQIAQEWQMDDAESALFLAEIKEADVEISLSAGTSGSDKSVSKLLGSDHSDDSQASQEFLDHWDPSTTRVDPEKEKSTITSTQFPDTEHKRVAEQSTSTRLSSSSAVASIGKIGMMAVHQSSFSSSSQSVQRQAERGETEGHTRYTTRVHAARAQKNRDSVAREAQKPSSNTSGTSEGKQDSSLPPKQNGPSR